MNRFVLTAVILSVLALSCCGRSTKEATPATTPASTPTPEAQGGQTMLTGIAQAADAEAMSAGNNVKTAQYAYRAVNGRFAESMEELSTIDRSLNEDPNIRFVFGACDDQGFTFTVISRSGDRIVLTD